MGILYFLLSAILFVILAPIGIVYGVLRNYRGINKKFIGVAESIDRFGNVICAEIFNHALLKNSAHPFGDGRETISSVIGRNVRAGTLSGFGTRINGVLNKVKKNHSVDNIGY